MGLIVVIKKPGILAKCEERHGGDNCRDYCKAAVLHIRLVELQDGGGV